MEQQPIHRKTHCKRGHEFTLENTYINKAGARICRTCAYDWHKRYEEENRDRNRALRQAWVVRNHDHVVAQRKARYQADRENVLAYMRQEHVKAKHRVYAKDNYRKNRGSVLEKVNAATEKLDDNYIRQLLRQRGYPKEVITPEVLDIYRTLVKLKRKVYNYGHRKRTQAG